VKRLIVIGLAASLALSAAAKPKKSSAPKPADAPAPPPASVMRFADGQRVDLAAEGTLLGWAALRAEGGGRVVYALIGPAPPEDVDRTCAVEGPETPRGAEDAKLFRWSLQSPDRLEPLPGAYPHGTLEAADLDGDGHDELVLLREGEIDEIAPASGALNRIVHEAAFGKALPDPRAARSRADAADPALRLIVDGSFATYRREPGGDVRATASLDLPVRITKGSGYVQVVVPEAVLIGAPDGGYPMFGTIPEQAGPQRLRTWVLQPEAPAAERARECWLQLPAAERALDTAFAMIDGTPSLIVTTMSSEKLDLFGEKRLRVFSLGSDRTRAGASPRFAATTGLNLWQVGYPAVADVNGDAKDDLVIGYWKGLKRRLAALEVYPGQGGGAFGKPRSMELNVEGGDEAYLAFGQDVDGDHRADLLVIANGELRVYPGNAPEAAAGKPVRNEPSRRVALLPGLPNAGSITVSFSMSGGLWVSRRPPGLGTPRQLDLDADGRPELIFAGDLDGRARISVVTLRGAGSTPGAGGLADGASISYK
jgi:hypothetical protein